MERLKASKPGNLYLRQEGRGINSSESGSEASVGEEQDTTPQVATNGSVDDSTDEDGRESLTPSPNETQSQSATYSQEDQNNDPHAWIKNEGEPSGHNLDSEAYTNTNANNSIDSSQSDNDPIGSLSRTPSDGADSLLSSIKQEPESEEEYDHAKKRKIEPAQGDPSSPSTQSRLSTPREETSTRATESSKEVLT